MTAMKASEIATVKGARAENAEVRAAVPAATETETVST
jgi:hypothetical protein